MTLVIEVLPEKVSFCHWLSLDMTGRSPFDVISLCLSGTRFPYQTSEGGLHKGIDKPLERSDLIFIRSRFRQKDVFERDVD